MLQKTFQLRAARAISNVTIRDLGAYLGVSHNAMARWETYDGYDDIHTDEKKIEALNFFFQQYNLSFPDSNTIELTVKNFKNVELNCLTSFQLRAARTSLKLDRIQLSKLLNIDYTIIPYLERYKSFEEPILGTPKDKLVDIKIFQDFFEKRGIRFPQPLIIQYFPHLALD